MTLLADGERNLQLGAALPRKCRRIDFCGKILQKICGLTSQTPHNDSNLSERPHTFSATLALI